MGQFFISRNKDNFVEEPKAQREAQRQDMAAWALEAGIADLKQLKGEVDWSEFVTRGPSKGINKLKGILHLVMKDGGIILKRSTCFENDPLEGEVIEGDKLRIDGVWWVIGFSEETLEDVAVAVDLKEITDENQATVK